MPDSMGQCDTTKGHLDIRSGQSPFEHRDTVLHEALHAVLHQQGRFNSYEEEEPYVRAIATGLMGVFQDNPEFASWLIAPITQ